MFQGGLFKTSHNYEMCSNKRHFSLLVFHRINWLLLDEQILMTRCTAAVCDSPLRGWDKIWFNFQLPWLKREAGMETTPNLSCTRNIWYKCWKLKVFNNIWIFYHHLCPPPSPPPKKIFTILLYFPPIKKVKIQLFSTNQESENTNGHPPVVSFQIGPMFLPLCWLTGWIS